VQDWVVTGFPSAQSLGEDVSADLVCVLSLWQTLQAE
jgi:hypothetical protein